MKVVISKCFGGFNLSPLAVSRIAELEGKECYAFEHNYTASTYTPTSIHSDDLFVVCFDVPNPDDFSEEELWDKHHLTSRPSDRTSETLIKVIEELGEKANGRFAELSIVEIPCGVDFEIDEYDGIETIHEKHRSWS